MSTVKAVLFLLCVGVALVASQTAFTSKVTISNRQGMSGAITGTFSYNSGLASMRINLNIGPVELYNYTARLKFLQCGGTCETETWQLAMPILYPEADDTVGAGSINGCQERRKARGGAPTIYVNGANQVCRAVFADNSIYDFSAWGAAEGVANFQPPANCPKPLCTKRIDFELVFDESGSISANSFKQEKSFAQDFARSFTWGYDYVGMGLSMFASNSRLAIPLTFSQATFIQGAALVTQRGGSTCIGCGIQTSLDDVSRNGRTIPGTNTPVSRVFLVLTDGENNVGNYQVPLNSAKNQGIILFAIGIGSVDRNQIEIIGTDLPGIQTTFYGTDFSALPTILNGLITATCVNIPGNPCGAACLGYCACGKNCICPDDCNDGNACTTDVCSIGANGNGCRHPDVTCDDNNACTRDSCNPATGCVYTPISCDDNNQCTADSCDPRSGCVNAVITCSDASPCTADSCNPSSGCQFTPIQNCPAVCSDPTAPINCPKMNCYTNECDPLQNGKCVATPIPCDDRNPCTIDRCDNATGKCVFTPKNCDDNNKCTIDSCDATGTCQNIPFNATSVCNDYNACTIDTCEPAVGCVNKNRTCDDGDRCTNNMCSTVTGCYYPPVDCWQQDPDLKNHPDLIGCYEAVCLSNSSRVSGLCMLTTINGSAIDKCGVCNGDNSACENQINSQVAAGLGGGAIAGIVIGAAGVAAVLGVLGGKKGYDIWLKHRANMQGANTNPLYTNNGLAGNNPMYEEGA